MSEYSTACKFNIRSQFVNLRGIRLNYKCFKTCLIRCTVCLTPLLFTIRLVDFIKFPDYFHVVAVNMYFYLIRNEISCICFTTCLFIKAMGTGASLLRTFKSRYLAL